MAEDRISFFCGSCGKNYKVPLSAAGRKAKCKACGEMMSVPKAKPKAQEKKPDDDFIGLVEDDDETSRTRYPSVPKAPPVATPASSTPKPRPEPKAKSRPKRSSSASKSSAGESEPPEEEDWLSTLAPPPGAEVAAEPEPEPFAPGQDAEDFEPQIVAYTPVGKPGRRKSGGGFGGMKEAFLDSLRPSSGDVSPLRRISVGGLFILISAIVCIVAANVAPEVVIGAGGSGGDFGFSSAMKGNRASPSTLSNQMPGMVYGGIGIIISIILIGLRIYAPRKEAENPLILVICAALLLTILVVTLFTLIGQGASAVVIGALGILAVLLSSAVIGGWVIYRLNQDASGLAIGRWLLPAILIPVGGVIAILIEILILSEGEANIGKLPWGPILLAMLITGVIIFFMGSVVAFYLVLIVPFLLLASEIKFGAGMVIMLVVLLVCIYCYVSVFKDNWRELSKPVLWQFTMLFFGTAVMVNMISASARAQVGINQGVIASEEEEAQKHFEQTGERTEASSSFKRAIKRNLMAEKGIDSPDNRFNENDYVVIVKENGEFDLTFIFGAGASSPDAWDGKLPPMSLAQVEAMNGGGSETFAANVGSSNRPSGRNTTRIDYDAPPEPMVSATELPTGMAELDASGEVWEPFGLPSSAADRLSGTSINLGGVTIPEVTGLTVDVMKRGRDVKFLKIEDESADVIGSNPVMELSLRFAAPKTPEQWVSEFDDQLDNLLRLARLSRSDRYADRYVREFGSIGGMRVMRFEVFPVRSTGDRGAVHYMGYLPGVEGRWITLSYQTNRRDPESMQRFETMVRSMVLQEESWAEEPAGPIEPGLIDQDRDLRNSNKIVGPVAMPPSQSLRSVEFVETNVAHGVIEPATLIPQKSITDPERSFAHRANMIYFKCVPAVDRDPDITLPRVRLTGSSEISDIDQYVVSAYGGDVSYLNLWDDQPFVRIDHGIVSIEDGASISENEVLYKTTYAGFLGDFYFHVDLMMEPDATGKLALDEAFRSGQLLTMENVEDYGFRNSGFGKSLIDNRLDFPVKGGLTFREFVDANPSDLYVYGYGTGEEKIDRSTRPTGRPGVDVPGAPERFSEVEPKMDLEDLKKYREWRAFGSDDKLGEEVEVAGYKIQAPRDLRMANSNARGARWVPPSGGSSVGMILELETLKPEHHNLTHPIIADENGNRSFLLGPRVMPDRTNAEITYREENGIRVWRILPAYERDDRIATVYYCVQDAEQMIVLTARFQPSKWEQLRVFDAAAATLKPGDAPAEED